MLLARQQSQPLAMCLPTQLPAVSPALHHAHSAAQACVYNGRLSQPEGHEVKLLHVPDGEGFSFRIQAWETKWPACSNQLHDSAVAILLNIVLPFWSQQPESKQCVRACSHS